MRWVTADYAAGDVVVFSSRTVGGTLVFGWKERERERGGESVKERER